MDNNKRLKLGSAGGFPFPRLIVFFILGAACNALAQSPSGAEPVSGPESGSEPASTMFPPAEGVQTGSGGRIVRETAVRAASEEELPYHLHFQWESRYVSEGRDNLLGGGIATVTTDIKFGLLTFSPWYAYGYNSDYEELDLNLVLGFQPTDEIELYAGYTHLRFFKDNLYDNEAGAGVVLKYLNLADYFVTGTYSFDAEGTFVETGLSREFQLSDQFTLKAVGLLGLNAGYMADGHDGANNIQLMLEASYKINPQLELTALAGHSWAINSDAGSFGGDESLHDFFWGGQVSSSIFNSHRLAEHI